MAEVSSTTQGDEPRICSIDSLRKLYEKHPKILFIATEEDRKDFAEKFANEAAPSDLMVVEVPAGGSCEAVEKLGLKDKPAAILVERGEVKDRITLQNDDIKDTVALMKVLSKSSEGKSCEAELTVDEKGWRIKLEPGSL